MEFYTEYAIRSDNTISVKHYHGNRGDDNFTMTETIIYANGGKVLSVIDNETTKLEMIVTRYGRDMKPIKVHMKKIVINTSLNIANQTENFYEFNVYYNYGGIVTTEDTFVSNGPLMKRTYEPVINTMPIIYVDGLFMDAEMVNETPI